MLKKFWDFVDERKIIRRVAIYSILGINIYCYWWATETVTAAMAIEKLSFDLGIILGAILTPASALMGKVFQWYNEGRVNGTERNDAA